MAAQEGRDIGFAAAADYSAAQYKCVDINTSGQAVLISAAGQRFVGILQDDPAAAGRSCLVRVSGTSKAWAGGTITNGDTLTTDSSGRVVTRTAGNQVVVGIAMHAASSGEIVEVMLTPMADPREYAGKIWTVSYALVDIADGDLITEWTPGFAGKIVKFSAAVTKAATTGSKLSTLNLEIGTTNVTGGVLALTSNNMTPKGVVVDATAITAANTFGATDKLSIEASSTTAFVEGSINLFVVMQ